MKRDPEMAEDLSERKKFLKSVLFVAQIVRHQLLDLTARNREFTLEKTSC